MPGRGRQRMAEGHQPPVHLGSFTTLLSDLGSNVVSELLGVFRGGDGVGFELGDFVSFRMDLDARRDHRVRVSPIRS